MTIELESDATETLRNAVARYEASEPFETVPFNDDLTKDEMIAHIIDVHQLSTGTLNNKSFGKYGTKVTKDEMIRWHEAQHTILDSTETLEAVENGRWGGNYVQRKGMRGSAYLPTIRHNHMADAPLTDEQKQAAAAVRSGKKVDGVLSATERKVLTQVVDNDFGTLKQEMRAFAADTLTSVKADINDEWDTKEKSIPDFATKATEDARKYNDKKRALRDKFNAEIKVLDEAYQDKHADAVRKAKDAGVDLVGSDERYFDEQHQETRNRTVFKATVAGRNEAIEAAEKENTTMLNRALMDLERQRLTAQRQVLLSGVPEGAMTILESIPDAKTLMVQSQQDSARQQIEAREEAQQS